MGVYRRLHRLDEGVNPRDDHPLLSGLHRDADGAESVQK